MTTRAPGALRLSSPSHLATLPGSDCADEPSDAVRAGDSTRVGELARDAAGQPR